MGRAITALPSLISKPYVRQAFRKYLDCGIFARGFARARCGDCRHDYFDAFSCKGRRVCPLCNTRRMVETAAHLTDHVFARLPVRHATTGLPKAGFRGGRLPRHGCLRK